MNKTHARRICNDFLTCPKTVPCPGNCERFNADNIALDNATIPYSGKGEYGWVCPKCGNVYSPWMSICTKCNKE